MHRLAMDALIVALFVLAFNSAQAAQADLSQWFLRATAFDAPGTHKPIATPDFLGGKRQGDLQDVQSLCAFKWNFKSWPLTYDGWLLLKYDRKHHIGLAAPHDDANGCALFKAPAPAGTVPDADLSQSSTGRGLRIGSTYAQVLSIYGPPVKHGRHFVTSYSATVQAVAEARQQHKQVELPERITLVIDNERVSSILIYIEESALY